MSQIIPMISSGTAGPLGMLHLPRLWLKASLGAVGKLHPDYPALAPGYDQMVLAGLGIAIDDFAAFIAAEKPTYPRCEEWILEKCGGSVDPQVIADVNAAILGYNHKDAVRQTILAANGKADDGSLLDAVGLNQLDDWLGFHQAVIHS
jgi:hypothetical protein